MSYQDGYSQAPLTFVDTGGDYGADTQGLDYEYAFSLSQTQTQTQSSQLTQSEPRATGKDLCANVCISGDEYSYTECKKKKTCINDHIKYMQV